ncbi:MAG TPA: GFA family protein [Devosia sp.]|nr:GFA family protein [Devosia sp.]
MTDAKIYHGQCHCGAVRFTAETDLTGLMDCNCSRCRRLGWVLKSVPAARFTLLSGEDKLTEYRFNTDRIEHLFCSVCGIESFSRGRNRQGDDLMMINVNCLDDAPPIDRSALTHWDGASM